MVIIIILKVNHREMGELENKLRQVFDKTPFFVDGKPMLLEANLGLSSFPEDGENLCELSGLSLSRASQIMRFSDVS